MKNVIIIIIVLMMFVVSGCKIQGPSENYNKQFKKQLMIKIQKDMKVMIKDIQKDRGKTSTNYCCF